jgi:Holliday junction resolvasome RuvABC endonuclease subunit
VKRPEPTPWPEPWKAPGGWITDTLGSASNAVRASACHYVDALPRKPLKTEPLELLRLREAVLEMRRHFKSPELPFPPIYVRVLGIDPGLANVGVMMVDFSTDAIRAPFHQKITTTPDDGTEEHRLNLIAQQLHTIFAERRPDVVAYENVVNVGHSLGETSSAAVRMLEMCGMIRMCCQLFACRPCYAVTTATARKAIFGRTPRGTTRTKQDVKTRVAELLGLRGRLSEDVAEAGALCFGGFSLHMEAERERSKQAPDAR